MYRSCFEVIACAALVATITLAATPAQPQSLSDKLNKTISSAKRPDGTVLLDDAAKAYRNAIGDEANASPAKRRVALKSRASVYEQAREYGRAEADYGAAIGIAPPDPSDHADRGYFYLRRSRYNEAIADFTAAARLEPASSRHPFAIGRVYAAMRDYPAAINHYDQAIRINPRDSLAVLARAEAKLHLKRYADAKADYDRAIRIGLRRPNEQLFGYMGRGYASLVGEEAEAAIADFDAALAVDPGALNVRMWRGYANEKRGRPDLALDDYERAFMVDPGNATVAASLRRLRAREPLPVVEPAFQVDERQRLAADAAPGLLPRRRPHM